MIPATDPRVSQFALQPSEHFVLCLGPRRCSEGKLPVHHRGALHFVMWGWEDIDSILADFKLLPNQHCSPTSLHFS